MSPISSYTDFHPLKEIILGSAHHVHLPRIERSLIHFFEPPESAKDERVAPQHLARVLEETQEDLDALAATLAGFGVTVRTPDPVTHGTQLTLPGWTAESCFSLMPRDCLAVVGETVIEAPMPSRSRYVETFGFRRLLREYFEQGANWVAAPRPQLTDGSYLSTPDGVATLAEDEPLFDAANLIRCGADVFFNISNTGNRIGATWLGRVLGPRFRIHEISICPDHVGTTVQLLRPGVLLANAGRLGPDDIPAPLRSWRTLWFDDPADDGYAFEWPRASVWVGMNVLSVDEQTVIVPENQTGLCRLLEKEGFTVVPQRYRHGRTFGGGFHCCSLDVRRTGSLESYL